MLKKVQDYAFSTDSSCFCAGSHVQGLILLVGGKSNSPFCGYWYEQLELLCFVNVYHLSSVGSE